MVRQRQTADNSASSSAFEGHPYKALLDVQTAINELNPEDHAALLAILDRAPRSAETVLNHVRHLNKVEQRRLGMLLAREDILPGWRVVQAYGVREVTAEGLSGQEARLYRYLHPPGSKHHRNNCILHLWPHEHGVDIDISGNATLQARLRKLQSRTNRSLSLYGKERRIVRRGAYLVVS
jgi:hypothetical protein